MPHIIVKLWPGQSEEQKARLAEAITKDVMNIFNNEEGAISVAMEEIQPKDWGEKVFQPDIISHPENLYKAPGYTM